VNAGLSDRVTWHAASERCKAAGGDLATVSSLHEQDGLTALLGLQSLSAWIGLHLLDGVHSWVRGSPVVFTNWGKGQPAGRGTRCTFVDRHFTSLGEWGDEECDVPMGYICQADPIPDKGTSLIPKLDGLFVRGRCADGYYEYRKQCFGIHSMLQSRSATDLRDPVTGQCRRMVHIAGPDCSTHWGTVTCPVVGTPHTHADAAFLRVLLSQFGGYAKNAWIGLKVRRNNGSLQTFSEDESLLGASTLIAFDRDSLTGSDRWDSTDSRYHCVVASILNTQLKVVDCEEIELPAICAYYLDDHALHSKNRAIDADKCPPGWSPFGGKCYAVMPPSDRKNWSAAEKTCNSLTTHFSSPLDVTLEGHLVSIHSLEEQHHLTELAPNTSLWLGLNIFYEPLYGQVPSNSIIHTNRSVHLLWTDDSPVDYVSFSRDSSVFGTDQMDCFTIDGDNSQWNPTECFQERNFICQLSSSDVSEDVSETQDTPVLAVNCDNTFPLNSKSSGDCYRILQSAQTWASAERACSSLRTGAHLASFHNREELDELVDLVSQSGFQKENVWIGLYESDLAYHWSDESAVTYIPLSADQSKYGRHLSQDCFVLSPSLDVGSYTVRAVDCSSSQSVMVCKSPSKNPIPSRIDDPTQWKLMICPPGYRQYADRCFSVLQQSTTWAEGDRRCVEQAKQFHGYSGSLARIDTSLVQGKLSNSSPVYWMICHRRSRRLGLDCNKAFRMIHLARFGQMVYSVGSCAQSIEKLFRKSSTQDNFRFVMHLFQMCTALYRSTYPRLNGLWLQWSCEKPVLLASICQASPPPVRTDDLKLTSSSCPSGFYLGTTGLSPMSPGGRKISQPVCYRLLNTNKKLNWKESSEHCKALSTPGNNVSLLSVASVFEASFLRSWLRMPQEMGGAGLAADEPVWSGLQVTNRCPDCYGNWTWDTLDNASVRFTDWLIPPTPTPSGCYIFHPNPYTRRESMANSGLGSLQPVGSCDLTYFAVCQTLANETVEQHRTDASVTPAAHQAIRPNCFIFDAHGSDKLFLTNVTQSHAGRPCIRWDLVPNNLTDFRLDSSWLKHRLHMTEIVGADGFASYAENYCSVLYHVQLREYKYECYVSLDPLTSEECDLIPCPHILRRFYLLGPVTTAIILMFLLGAVIILAVGFWRGYAPFRSGYRRYFSPKRFSSSRVHRSSVQFVPPDTVSCVQPVHVNDSTNGYVRAAHNNKSKGTSEKVANPDQSRLLLNQPVAGNNDASDSPGYIYTPPVGPVDRAQTGFTNPIYAPHSFIVPEDDYDPEADM
ncbi:lectin C-type domain protein, partial [Opisthorchis viverrini]